MTVAITTTSPRWSTAAGGNACDITQSITSIKYNVLDTSAITVTAAIELGIYSIYDLAVNC